MTKSVFFFLAALATFFAISCGTRKTETSKTETSNEQINIENSYVQTTKTILGSSFTYTPFDGLKPMVIDGKKYQNTIVAGSNSKETSKTITKLQKVYVNHYFTITKTKQTQKTDASNLYIGLFLVFCFFVFAYFKKWF